MDTITDFKLLNIGFNPSNYGKILAIVDFGNVSKWPNEIKWQIDIIKLGKLLEIFCDEKHFFYGHKKRVISSEQFIMKARTHGFTTHTKQVKKIKHRPDLEELRNMSTLKRAYLKKDRFGKYYINIEKCDFDVEITMTILRQIKNFDTLMLWSGDGDFGPLVRYIRTKYKKKVIVVCPWRFFSTELNNNKDIHILPNKMQSLLKFQPIRNRRPLKVAGRKSNP